MVIADGFLDKFAFVVDSNFLNIFEIIKKYILYYITDYTG